MYYRPLRNRNYKDGETTATLPGIIRKPSVVTKQVSSNTVMSTIQCQNETSRMTECFDVYWVYSNFDCLALVDYTYIYRASCISRCTCLYCNVYVYQFIQWINVKDRLETHDYCMQFWMPCVERYWTLPCDACLRWCEENDAWQAGWCPNITNEAQ